MWAICKKEFRLFFSNLTGYLSVALFLLLNGLFLFVFSSFNILDFGYASLENFFTLAPFVLLLLIPAITMRLLPDEWRSGTMELLQTRPLTAKEIVTGKYLATLFVVLMALVPTLIYVVSIQLLAADNVSIDMGGTLGSYIGLLFLSSSFASISLCAGSFTNNAVVAFLAGAFLCFLMFSGPEAISSLPLFQSGADFYLQQLGMEYHYRSLARGVIDIREVVYFLSVIILFLFITTQRVQIKK